MFNNKLKLRRGLTLVVFTAAAISANTASATSTVAGNIRSICAAAGNEMIVNTGSCTACHNDGSGGSGAGKTAALGNTATILAFFCPTVIAPPPPAPTCTDIDGDGYSIEGGTCGAIDCNDRDPMINPGAQEDCGDNVDNNCNGLIDTADPTAVNCPIACTDMDGDGYNTEGGACGAVDCDDNNAEINPGAEEICTDGTDNNCNDMIDAADAACAVPPTEPPTGGDVGDHDSDHESDHDSDHESDRDRRSSSRSRRDRNHD